MRLIRGEGTRESFLEWIYWDLHCFYKRIQCVIGSGHEWIEFSHEGDETLQCWKCGHFIDE